MAKKDRIIQTLECKDCKRRNYTYRRGKAHKQEKLTIKKYCKFCKKHTEHKTIRG
ncbi:MAG: 50S ribosomal protein L33 [Elusimicrobia bacterium]|nr:50S ribosomal protein L33 [Elusimicrobiota bacterium]